MKTIPQYCQKCRERNDLGASNCRRCGTRLMLVVFPQSLKYDTNHVPTYYEDHLLERVTSLELRLSQVAERLAVALDLMLRQAKTAHSDHLLLETLIESLNTLGAIEKDKLTKNWRERIETEELKEQTKIRRERLLTRILSQYGEGNQADLFAHLVQEGIKFLDEKEEKQAVRTLERALLLSPGNLPLLLFISESLLRADKFEAARNYLERALGLSPENSRIALPLAVLYAEEGKAAEAKILLNSVPPGKKANFCAGYARGMIAACEQDWSAALAAFKEALSAKNLPETHYLVGCAYFQLGRNKTALRHLQKAVEEDAAFADAWFMQSVIHELAGEKEKAREAAERAWASKEAGAQCLEFLKRRNQQVLPAALPFVRLGHQNNRLLTGGGCGARLGRLFREEFFKTFGR